MPWVTITYYDCFTNTDQTLPDDQRLNNYLSPYQEAFIKAELKTTETSAHFIELARRVIKDEHYKKIEEQLIDTIRKSRPKNEVIAWDGDNLDRNESFNQALLCHRETYSCISNS